MAAWPREVVTEEMEAVTVASSKRARGSLESLHDWVMFSVSSGLGGLLPARPALVSG